MPLEKQIVTLPMAFGIDEGTDEGSDQQGLAVLSNGIYDREGAVIKRGGFAAEAQLSGTARGMIIGGGSVGVVQRSAITPWVPGYGVSTAVTTVPVSDVSTLATFFGGRDILYSTSAVLGDFLCVASVEIDGSTTPIIYRVFDVDSGNLLHEQTIVSDGQHVRVVATATTIVVAWSQDTTGDSRIFAKGYTPAFGSLSLPTGNTIVATAHESTPIDLACGNGTTVYLAYVNFSGTQTEVQPLTTAGATSGSPTTYWQTDNNSPPMHVSIACPVASTRYFVVSKKDGTNAFIGTPGQTAGGNLGVSDAIVSPGLTSGAVMTQSIVTGDQPHEAAGTSQEFLWTGTVIDSVPGSAVALENYVPASRAFQVTVDGTARLAQVVFRPNERVDGFFGAFLIDPLTSTGGTVPYVYGQLGAGDASYRIDDPSNDDRYLAVGDQWDVSLLSATRFVAPLLATLESDSTDTDLIRFRGRLALTEMQPTTITATTLNGTAYIAGSLPRMYDGRVLQTVATTGPAPKPQSITPLGTGLQLTGTFSYVAVLEVTNSKGQIYLSAVSDPVIVTVVATRIRLKLSNFLLGTDVQRVEGKLYRTTDGDAEYHLLYQERLPVGDSFEYEDLVDDVTLESRELIYTDGDVLESEPVRGFAHLWSHRNRLFGINAETPTEVWFSKEAADPVAPQWNQVLVKRVENAGGPLIGGASLGDKCVLFQRDQILIFSGQGPDALGDNDSFSTPEIISHGVGAMDCQSIVQVPAGLMFRSDQGFYQLGTDLSITFVGASVLDSERAMGSTVAAAYIPTLHQVWFAGSANATILVFDVRFNRWSTFALPASVTGIAGIIGFGTTAYLVTTGASPLLLSYDPERLYDVDLDGATKHPITETLELPWFRGAGNGAMQRLWKVELGFEVTNPSADQVSVHTFSRMEERPTKASLTADNSYAWTSLSGFPSGALTLSARLKQQRCTQSKVRITITQAAASEVPGMRLTFVRMHFGVLPSSKSPVRPTIS
jgi:hypothetical protein